MAHKTKTGKVIILITKLPIRNYHVQANKWHAHIGQFLNWTCQCKCNDVPYAMLGYIGKKWDDEQIRSSVTNGTLLNFIPTTVPV